MEKHLYNQFREQKILNGTDKISSGVAVEHGNAMNKTRYFSS